MDCEVRGSTDYLDNSNATPEREPGNDITPEIMATDVNVAEESATSTLDGILIEVGEGGDPDALAGFHPYRYVSANLGEFKIKDFTDVWHLNIGPVKRMEEFFATAPLEKFYGLESLQLGLWNTWETTKIFEEEAQDMDLLKKNIRSLIGHMKYIYRLQISAAVFETIIPHDLICQLGQSLTCLSIFMEWSDSKFFSMSEMDMLLLHCPNIIDLDLVLPHFPDNQVLGCGPEHGQEYYAEEFLALLARFTKLEYLRLVAENGVGTENLIGTTEPDPELETGIRILRNLVDRKLGQRYKYIQITMYESARPKNWIPNDVPNAVKEANGEYLPQDRGFTFRFDENGEQKYWSEDRPWAEPCEVDV